MNHTDLYNEAYTEWAERTPKTAEAIKRRAKVIETLEWMGKNAYHFTKVRTGKGARWNLFDCRDANCIRFIGTFKTLGGLVKHVAAGKPFC